MGKFKELAQKATLQSMIMADREPLKTSDVVNKELTIIGFGFADKRDQDTGELITDMDGNVLQYGIVIFKELPNKYYSVGTVFTKVCETWAAEYGGDEEVASAELEKEGGVRVMFSEGKTKRSRNVVNVKILG